MENEKVKEQEENMIEPFFLMPQNAKVSLVCLSKISKKEFALHTHK